MLTAEGGDQKVTCDSSHFKKLDQDHADPVSVDTHSSADPASILLTQTLVQTQYQLIQTQVQVLKLNPH